MEWEWDGRKNEKNFFKHGIWFEEASTVFSDPNALEIFDEEHSRDKDRFVLLGISSLPRLLIVVYCERGENNVRIISARKATKMETEDYEKGI